MRVIWSPEARESLAARVHRVRHFGGEEAVGRLLDRIDARIVQIAEYPYSGRMVPEYASGDIREAIEPPLRIIYQLGHDQIEILMVFHGSRDLSI